MSEYGIKIQYSSKRPSASVKNMYTSSVGVKIQFQFLRPIPKQVISASQKILALISCKNLNLQFPLISPKQSVRLNCIWMKKLQKCQ